MIPDQEIVGQLATLLDVQTEMGKAYLNQVLQNARLFEKKQRDYGSGNIAVFGEKGVVVRTSDKVMRLKNLVIESAPERPVNNEAITDSWDDIANYGVIGRLCRDGIWK